MKRVKLKVPKKVFATQKVVLRALSVSITVFGDHKYKDESLANS